MSSEQVLIQTRKDKHQQLNQGAYPLAAHAWHCPIDNVQQVMQSMQEASTLLTSISPQDLSGSPSFLVAGRIALLRKSGAITFLKLTDGTGSVQLIASKAALPDYQQISLLDLGDIIEIRGYPCLSKTGEKSLLITEWKLLTKAIRPPPEKFAGIADTELKYRKRYLDLMSSEESRARFMVRSMVLGAIRKMLYHEEFVEAETSTLNTVSSGANAKPFTTHHNALDTDLYLRIAPELYLKRLLVGGFDKVYEIGRAYRNEGIDTRHNPEFTILECYQAYADFPQLIEFTQRLLENVDLYLDNECRYPFLREYIQQWKAERPFTLRRYGQISMTDAVSDAANKAGIKIEWNDPAAIHDVKLVSPGNERSQRIDNDALWANLDGSVSQGEQIAILFEHIAEPFLAEDYRTDDGSKSVPIFITKYPKEACPLARANDANPEVCDRFELFIEGRELANAFQELNDPAEQAIRFQQQLEHASRDPMQHDEDYIQALEHGLPPCVGFGMGIERLVMLLTNTASIKDVILFPTLKPVKEDDEQRK